MLTAEHVRVSRRKGGLAVMPRCGLADDVAAGLLDALIAVAREHHGRTRGELAAALDDVRLPEDGRTNERALRAAQKLVLDRCGFAARDDLDPPALRAAVFAAAAEARARAPASDDVTNERPGVPAESDARAPGGQPAATSGDDDDFDDFDRARVLAGVAAELGIDAATLEGALWADLEDAHVVDAGALAGLTGAALLPTWHEAELQALLLRARRVVVDVDASPAQLRALLRALKLHQLLFAVEPVDVDARDGGGWSGAARLVIEGPMALFSSSTRYGLKLALLLPHVLACRRHRLVADVAWKKHGAPEPFVVAGRGDARARDADDDGHDALPPLVSTLLHELTPLVAAALPGFSVRPAQEVVVVAGGGAFVPDLVVDHADGSRAFVEVLGFWSREAVWRRVAWAEQGVLPAPAVFCVSERLRVSEAALDDDAGGALVVFKGSLSAKKVAAALVARLAAPAAAAGG